MGARQNPLVFLGRVFWTWKYMRSSEQVGEADDRPEVPGLSKCGRWLRNITLKSYYKSSSGFEVGGMIQLESNEFKAATEDSDANEYWTIKNVCLT